MNRKVWLLPAAALLASGLLLRAAAGDGGSERLVSLSYLNGTYMDSIQAKVDDRLDASDRALRADAGKDSGGEAGVLVAECADVWTEQRLKEGDVLTGYTGLSFLTLAGNVTVSFSGGAVIDVTAGTAVSSGSALTANHRYLVAEDTTARFSVGSPTAAVSFQGYYTMTLSDSVDYNAMAGALKTLHLFRGSFTGYGQGYDLEKAPTRLQALIMFIRVLGEEDAALSWSGTLPFRDLERGSDAARYVGYAYQQGYTNGYTASEWRPGLRVSVNQYTEFILRALGYSSSANTELSDALDRAQDCGLLSREEAGGLGNQPFLRAQLVYLSYCALETDTAGTGLTLGDLLLTKGVYTAEEAETARSMVPSGRTLGA